MKKITFTVTVEHCLKCPFSFIEHKKDKGIKKLFSVFLERGICRKTNRIIHWNKDNDGWRLIANLYGIPEWCPLLDKEN